ncbi:acyl-CoA thioester hydrolase/BAAT C-terminal domain-containing protein [Nocardioides sp.]|uniref:acyl-CoA thioester hydrolase/BAAT C-terminal domain-containing protein n=1 Tax=Nocardioides sp. TaxID=35761 RepID=UPI0039E326CF
MRQERLSDPPGIRWLPDRPSGVGVLVLAGSRGQADPARARLFASQGAIAESIQWFGGPGQHEAPWEIPVETIQDRVAALARECDRVVVAGLSFGAEAALVVASYTPQVEAVVAFSPLDVVWAGVRPDGSQTSHWTLAGEPLPFVPFAEDWEPDDDPPAYRGLYLRSRELFPDAVVAATIAVEQIPSVVLVAGGDDEVWPANLHAERIATRRAAHGRSTTLVTDPEAGHRAILPGEEPVTAGIQLRRGGTEAADRRLGVAAWGAIVPLLTTVR